MTDSEPVSPGIIYRTGSWSITFCLASYIDVLYLQPVKRTLFDHSNNSVEFGPIITSQAGRRTGPMKLNYRCPRWEVNCCKS